MLLVTHNFPPTICGVGDYSYEIMRRFPQFGINPSVLAANNTPQAEIDWGKEGESQVFTTAKFGIGLYRDIMAICRKHGIPLIFWQYAPNSYHRLGLPFYLLPVMLLLWLKGLRQAIFFHEISLRAWGFGLRQCLHAIGQQTISRAMAAMAQQNITSIAFYKQYLWPSHPQIVAVGANIYAECQRASPDGRLQKKPLKIFCFTSRFDGKMAACIKELQELEKGKFIWVFAGKATSKSQQQALMQLGSSLPLELYFELPMQDLAEKIQDCDLYFQPNTADAEGRGGISAKNGSIIAAMAAGKTIVANQGDMTDRQLFVHGHNVWFVGEDKLPNYISALQHLGNNAGLRKKLGEAALSTYRTVFDWDVIVRRLSEII